MRQEIHKKDIPSLLAQPEDYSVKCKRRASSKPIHGHVTFHVTWNRNFPLAESVRSALAKIHATTSLSSPHPLDPNQSASPS